MSGNHKYNDQCGCCGARGAREGGDMTREELGAVDSRRAPVAASDAAWLEDTRARRLLCTACGALEIVYDPADALAHHFARNYNLGGEVQNNLVVRQGRVARKKSLIDARLDDWIADWDSYIGAALEIACGRGELITRLASDHPHWRCAGVDPNADLAPSPEASPGAPRLLRSFFSHELFDGDKFGLMIAHGFLNRSPTIRELRAMRDLCAEGALVSLEVLLLDTSPHCPAIWDHSYMFSQQSFLQWLAATGFELLDMADNASSWHVIARAVAPRPGGYLADGEPARTARLYRRFDAWWEEAVRDARVIAAGLAAGERLALFGAGMFTAALLARAPDLAPACILDDVKAGREFLGVPVIAPEAAPETIRTIVFTRPAYVQAIADRLRARDLAFDIVPGAAASARHIAASGAA